MSLDQEKADAEAAALASRVEDAEFSRSFANEAIGDALNDFPRMVRAARDPDQYVSVLLGFLREARHKYEARGSIPSLDLLIEDIELLR